MEIIALTKGNLGPQIIDDQLKTNPLLSSANLVPGLTPKVINGVRKFVFFVGYGRSGHSIIGTLMDAHPHVVIAHQFLLFHKFTQLNEVADKTWKDNLFNLLYKKSVRDSTTARARLYKGYTLGVEGLWQGKFDEYIDVIGDKSGSMVTGHYLKNKDEFKSDYQKLQKELSMPLRIIHALRNPFDMVATGMAMHQDTHKLVQLKGALNFTESKRATDPKMIRAINDINKEISKRFSKLDAEVETIDFFGKENVLEVHNCDLVNDPKGTISDFLEVETSTHYLDVCSEKVFKSVSRTRDLVEWTPEQRKMVETKMKNRYSFTSD